MKKLLNKIIPKVIGMQINAMSLWSRKAAARKAFLIFCTPRAGRIKEDQKEYLETAKDLRLTVNDTVTVQTYRWEGTGPTILLIHGWESNAHRWWKLIDVLQKRNYNIIGFDAPAHGNSTGKILNVPLYTEALEIVSQHYKPEVHVGHSVGGLTTIFHYYRYQPKYIKKLVSLGAPSELSEIMKDYQQILGMNNSVMKGIDLLVQKRFGFSTKEFSGASFAKAIDVSGLIIHDTYDRITPVEASRGIHKNWKNSTFIETSGFGHSLYQDEVR
ncbi:alpha/beta hydrolase, partial [uncultured Dokdonia sp.]|uniref:alpha/beta hydrolase n=1 Tax=uncultured Dokdonia sp. TaxID=575653 RepID=UPI002617CAA5